MCVWPVLILSWIHHEAQFLLLWRAERAVDGMLMLRWVIHPGAVTTTKRKDSTIASPWRCQLIKYLTQKNVCYEDKSGSMSAARSESVDGLCFNELLIIFKEPRDFMIDEFMSYWFVHNLTARVDLPYVNNRLTDELTSADR